jgi:rubrerythrin
VFQKLAEEEKEHLGTLEARYTHLLAANPELESRPAFLFFKGAANGLFSEGADRLSRGVSDQQALMIGIRCERGSHRFFRKYGERFEDSEGKQIFMEFAAEEKQHLELLINEYKNLIKRKGRQPQKAAVRARRAHA